MACTIRCKRSAAPVKNCRCSCGGGTHGSEASSEGSLGSLAAPVPVAVAKAVASWREAAVSSGGRSSQDRDAWSTIYGEQDRLEAEENEMREYRAARYTAEHPALPYVGKTNPHGLEVIASVHEGYEDDDKEILVSEEIIFDGDHYYLVSGGAAENDPDGDWRLDRTPQERFDNLRRAIEEVEGRIDRETDSPYSVAETVADNAYNELNYAVSSYRQGRRERMDHLDAKPHHDLGYVVYDPGPGPRKVYSFDVETLRGSDEVEKEYAAELGGKSGWSRPDLFGYGYGVVEDVKTGETFRFGPEEAKGFIDKLDSADVTLSYNGNKFDLRVLAAHGDVSGIKERHIDLCRVAQWKMQEEMGGIVKTGRPSMGGLDGLAKANGIEGKSGGAGAGAHAPELLCQGRLQELGDYCEKDVKITSDLYRKLAESGSLKAVPKVKKKNAEGEIVGVDGDPVEIRAWVPPPEALPEYLAEPSEPGEGTSSSSWPESAVGLNEVGPLGGSTGARLVEDPATGDRYVQKKNPKDPEHLREEARADEIYRAAGVPVPESRFYEEGSVKLSRFIDEGETLEDIRARKDKDANKKVKDVAKQGFAADALLGNWDVVGLDHDNLMLEGETVYRIDNGGALRNRAVGGRKNPERFNGSSVPELQSMRDPSRSAGRVFEGLPNGEVARQIREDLLPRRDRILEAAGEDTELRGILSERLERMREWADDEASDGSR